MKNSELIAILQVLPQDAETNILFDGCARASLDAAWLSNSGKIVVAAAWESVYDDEDRCQAAATKAEKPHLEVHEMMGLPDPADEEQE